MIEKSNQKYVISINLLAIIFVLRFMPFFVTPHVFFPFYRQLFMHLSESEAFLRYLFSFSIRVVGLLVGAGLLWRNMISRKLAVLMALMNLVLIYWQHPFELFLEKVCEFQELSGIDFSDYGITVDLLARAGVTIVCVIDALFLAFFVYFFTRKSVKSQFK